MVDAFSNGKAIVMTPDGKSCIIDNCGTVLLEREDELVLCTDGHRDWYAAYRQVRRDTGIYSLITAAYDSELRPIEWKMTGKAVKRERKGWWWVSEAGIEWSTPYESQLFPVSSDSTFHTRKGELVIFRRTEGDTDYWSAWNIEGNCLFAEQELEYLSILNDQVTGEAYLYAQQPDGGAKLYDRTGEYIMDCVNWPSISDGLVEVRSDLSYGYKNLDNEWVFRISLMKSRGD